MSTITDHAVAIAVVNEAKSRGIEPGPVPEDPAACIAKAQSLYDLALEAKTAGVAGEAVDAVIAAATQGNGTAPAAAPAPTPAPTPAPAQPAPVPAPAPTQQVSIDDVVPGYDDMKVAEILSVMEALTDEQIAFVKAYEASEGERAKILNFERHPMVQQPPAPTPEPAPAPTPAPAPEQSAPAQVDPSQYESVEPWPGYNKAKIGDIVERIESVLLNQGETAKPLLAHVWAYEKANKERTRLITKLTEIAQNGVQSAPPSQAPAEPTPAPAPAPTPAPQAQDEGQDVVAQPPFADQPAAPAPAPAPVPTQAPDSVAGIADPVANGATERATAMIAGQLPVPPDWQGEFPSPSNDFTTLTDIEVAKYQSQFNALHSRAIFVLAQAEGHVADAKVEAERLIRQYIAGKEWAAKATDTSKEAEATQNVPEVAAARKVQHEWAQVARQVSALATGYEKTAERLSREQTRREKDREHTR